MSRLSNWRAIAVRPGGLRAHTIRAEMWRSLQVAWPLIGSSLLQVGFGTVDALVAGRISTDSLAAGGIASAVLFMAQLICIGLMGGLSPVMSRLIGSGERHSAGAAFRQGLWLATVLGLAVTLVMSGLLLSVSSWGLDPAVAHEVEAYLGSARWCLMFSAVALAARAVFEVSGYTRPVLLVFALALLLNLLGDLVFGLGWFGFPALGLEGIGWTTTIVNMFAGGVLLWLLRGNQFRRLSLFSHFEWPSRSGLYDQLRVSVPFAFSLLFETSLFTATTLQIGLVSAVAASAHNIALNVAALCFMLPLGLGFAVTARIGVAVGRNHLPGLRLRIISGLLLTAIFMICTSLVMITLRYGIAGLYTTDPDVLALAVQLMLLAVVFQFSDGFQAILLAMLRGLHDTRIPMFLTAFSYWLVGFPIGFLFGHVLGMGAHGFWLGLIFGLSSSAILLAFRLRRVFLTVMKEGVEVLPEDPMMDAQFAQSDEASTIESPDESPDESTDKSTGRSTDEKNPAR